MHGKYNVLLLLLFESEGSGLWRQKPSSDFDFESIHSNIRYQNIYLTSGNAMPVQA
jgi:hypothetical protein